MPRTADLSRLSHDDLLQAVHYLIAQKRVSAVDIRRAADRAGRIAELERALTALKSGDGARKGGATAKPRRKFKMTPAMVKARKIQGQYLGRLKKLTGGNRERVKSAAKKDGVAAAVKLADQILGG